ncbi:MAG: type IV secretion system DNA-binding domain-containing protein, partial [Patescibacteria group bacterium]
RVPQAGGGDQQANTEQRIDQIREKIAVCESFFAAVGGLKDQRGLLAWLRGRTDHLSFEIVVQKKIISFYVAVSPAMAPYIQEQIHAQYPDAEIEEVDEYNIFPRQGVALGAYLKLAQPHGYPIKTYKKMDSDPLSAITNPLSQVEETDSAAIQFTIRSAHKKWRRKGIAMAKSAARGEGLGEGKSALASLGKEFSQAAFSSGNKDGQPDKPKQLTQQEQELVKNIEEKSGKAGMDVNARIVVASNDRLRAKRYLDNIVNAFSQYNLYQYGNTFSAEVPSKQPRLIRDFIYRSFNEQRGFVLNTEEMASVFHFPIPEVTETPGINWLEARQAPPPVNLPTEGLRLGRAVYRGDEKNIFIKKADRRRHFYIIGKSGSGKTVLMQSMIKQDIQNGEGVCLIDPNGDFAEDALSYVPESRIDDVIYFNPSDMERPMGLNMLEAKTVEEKDFVIQEMIAIFYRLVSDPSMIGPMFEHYMRNVMLTLMADPESSGTITEIPRMFTDDEYAAVWIAKLQDPMVRAFWEKEMSQMTANTKSDMLGYLISKVGRFVENEMMRNIIGQEHSSFDFREIMDKKKILIVNLAKGTVGEINANVLGMVIVSKLQMAAFARAELPEDQRHDFYLYIDEFQNFITDSIATILSEARKYRLDLIIAHQYLGQLAPKGDTKIRDAVLGNVGTIACYRIGVEDAEVLSKEFAPVFSAHDLINVEKYTAYIKLLIDNTAARPFNLRVDKPPSGNRELAAGIKELSRLKFGRDRRLVNAEIMERAQLGASAPTAEPELAKSNL